MTNEQIILNHLYSLPKQELGELLDSYVILSASRVYVPFIKVDDTFLRIPSELIVLLREVSHRVRNYLADEVLLDKFEFYHLSRQTGITTEELADDFNKHISEPYMLYIKGTLARLSVAIKNVVTQKYPNLVHNSYIYKLVSTTLPSVFLEDVAIDTVPLPSTYADVVGLALVRDLCEVVNEFLNEYYREWPSLGYRVNQGYISSVIFRSYSNETQE